MCLSSRAPQQVTPVHIWPVQPLPHEWPQFWQKESFLCILLLFGPFCWQLVTNKALLFISGEMILRPSFPFSTFKTTDSSSLFHFCILFCFGKCSFTNLKLLDIAGSCVGKWRVFSFIMSFYWDDPKRASSGTLVPESHCSFFCPSHTLHVFSWVRENCLIKSWSELITEMKHSGLSLRTGCS